MLKQFLFPFLILILFSSIISASSGDALQAEMMRGNQFYQSKNFSKAVDTYEGLVERGYSGTELFYNLGNAYYRTGKLGYAILYYEKALELSPSDEDVRHNLALANLQTADKIETFPRFFLFQWWESMLGMFSVSGWISTAYVLYIIVLCIVVFYFFIKRPFIQKYAVYTGFFSVLCLAVTIIFLTINLNRINNIKKGIIIEHTVTAKLSPDNRSNDAFVIHEGLKVNVEDKVDNWLKIKLEDGKIGWLPGESLKII